MTTTTLPPYSLATLLPADVTPVSTAPLFYHSDNGEMIAESGWNSSTQSLFERYKGKVCCLTDWCGEVPLYADDTTSMCCMLYAWVRNSDPNANEMMRFLPIMVQCHEQRRYGYTPVRGHHVSSTAFQCDASVKERAEFLLWWKTVWAVQTAAAMGKNFKENYLAQLRKGWQDTVSPKPVKGSKWRVKAGRKYPHGKVGMMFWDGKTRFGAAIGLAWSDKRDASGKFTDVGFINPANVEYVPNDTDQQILNNLVEDSKQADSLCDERTKQVLALLMRYPPIGDTPNPHARVSPSNLTMQIGGQR
jgi:hypothetical protein